MSSSEDDFVFLEEPEADACFLPEPPEVQQRIRKWLDPTEYDDGTSEYVKHLKSHLGGTGEWIESTPEYRQWHQSEDSNLLWVKAIAGAGKSVIAARTRARIARNERAPVLHFFFRHIITTNRTPKQLIRDWLAQLLPHSPLLQNKMKRDFLEQGRQLDAVTFDTLWRLLRKVASKLPRLYCFADALDEMSLGNNDFLLQLVRLGRNGSCKIFVTSRPVPHIVAGFRKVASPPVQIVLGPENMSQDISKYVDHRLDHDIGRYIDHRLATSGVNLSTPNLDDPMALLAREVLKSKSRGSFLYARLMTDSLIDSVGNHGGVIGREDLGSILESLPTGLNAMYAGMLEEHAQRTGTPWELQFSILQWVTHSERPLRLLELTAVIDFRKGGLQRSKDTKAIVRTACGPLLEILPSDVVGPIHHSFTEYLTSASSGKPIIDSHQAHRAMSEQCVRYLIGVLDQTGGDTDAKGKILQLNEAKLEYPFLDYAMQHWHKHIHKCHSTDDALVQLLDRLWLRNTSPGIAWLLKALGSPSRVIWLSTVSQGEIAESKIIGESNLGDWDDEARFGINTPKIFTPLHMAALAGLHRYIEHLLAMGYDAEGAEGSYATPIYCASEAGWLDAVTALLRAGADADAENVIGLKPLHAAATRNHVTVVKALLGAGIDPWTPKTIEHLVTYYGPEQSSIGNTPLTYVCREGHLETLLAFIPHLNEEGIARALRLTLPNEKVELTLALIETERLDMKLLIDDNLIHRTAAQGNLSCVEALLRRGFDANRQSEQSKAYRSGRGTMEDYASRLLHDIPCLPIHSFAKGKGSNNLPPQLIKRGLEMLVRAGNHIDAPDAAGNTPLFLARGSYKMANEILKLGADIQLASASDTTNLHDIAINGQSVEAALFWIKNGVDINARRALDGRTALMLSMSDFTECYALSNLLMEHGADPSIKDFRGWTALHLLASTCLSDKASGFIALIKAGADVNARTDEGDTALHVLLRNHFDQSGYMVLIDAGVHLESRNSRGETPLLALETIRYDLFQDRSPLDVLIDLGCRVDVRDIDGLTCIHRFWLHASYEAKVLERLIAAGVNPRWLDGMGNSSWHYMAGHGLSKMCEILRRQEIEHGRANYHGQTPFLLAAARNDTTLIDFLMSNYQDIDINRADIFGRTAMHMAATGGEIAMRRLIDLGADARARTNDGWTVLHFAAQARQPNMLILLLRLIETPLHDLVDAKDNRGRTALDYAARSAMPESVDILIEDGASLGDPYLIQALRFCTDSQKEARRWTQTFETQTSQTPDIVMGALRSEEDEDLGRKFGVYTHSRTSAKDLDLRHKIRLCVKRLITALKTVDVGLFFLVKDSHEPSRAWSSDQPAETVSLLCNALELDCEPVAQELIKASQVLPREQHEAGLRNLGFWHRLKLEGVQEKETLLLENIQRVERPQERDNYLFEILKDGNFDLLERFSSDVGVSLTTKNCDRRMLNLVVEEGYHEVLEWMMSRKAVESEPLDAMVVDTSDGPSQTKLSSVSQEDLGVWDAYVGLACSRKWPNLPFLKILLEHHPVRAQGQTAAVLKLSLANEAWHVEALEHVLRLGADPNSKGSDGQTPLHVACENSEWEGSLYYGETIRCLLKHGADPNILDDNGASCLIPKLELLRPLLAHGANVNIGRPSLLNQAIRAVKLDIVTLLIELGVDLNARAPVEGPSEGRNATSEAHRIRIWGEQYGLDESYPLHLAASMSLSESDHGTGTNRKSIVELLVNGGADPNLLTASGDPIAHRVIRAEQSDSVEILLKHPAVDLSLRDSGGNTVLLALADVLSGSLTLKLHWILGLVKRGADIEATNLKGQNILHLFLGTWMAHPSNHDFGSDECRELLLKCQEHSLTDAADREGVLPIHICLKNKLWKHAEVLTRYGADLSVLDTYGDTAFHHLARSFVKVNWLDTDNDPSGNTLATEDAELSRLVNVLKDANIDINARNKAGEPPFLAYIRTCPTLRVPYDEEYDPEYDQRLNESFIHRLPLLAAAGADIHGKSSDGQGALHILASLKDKGAEHRLSDRQKYDRANLAAWQMLVADGLDPYMEDNEQRTAIDVAAIAGNTAILELY